MADRPQQLFQTEANVSDLPIVTQLLGYMGLIPFFAAWAFTLQQHPISGISPHTVFMSYSAFILTFLAGTLWSRSLSYEALSPALKNATLVISNLIMLSAWASFILYPMSPLLATTLLLCGYLIVIISEHQLVFHIRANQDTRHHQSIPTFISKAYLTLRTRLTLLVVLAHILFISALLNG